MSGNRRSFDLQQHCKAHYDVALRGMGFAAADLNVNDFTGASNTTNHAVAIRGRDYGQTARVDACALRITITDSPCANAPSLV